MTSKERRQYIRLNSVFPVEFSLIFIEGEASSKRYEGFTHDVSKGGLCIKVKGLSTIDEKALLEKRAKLDLNINMLPPLFTRPIYAKACIAWIEKIEGLAQDTLYSIGVSYEDINPRDRDKIINYARRLVWLPRITAVVITVFLSIILALYLSQAKIRQQNQGLIDRLIEISAKRNAYFEKLNNVKQEKILLGMELTAGQSKIKELENQLSLSQEQSKITPLQQELGKLKQENLALKDRLKGIDEGETALKKKLTDISKESNALEVENIAKMKDWICVHRNKKTGLVISYEGDKAYEDWAFTYDQALAAQMFLLFKDIDNAALILDFYKDTAKTQDGLFYNAYDAQTTSPAEYTIHSGPNIWIAIAACRFTKYTNDAKYLKLAQKIADIMISMQAQSEDKGLAGGPSASWVSTEHNMDAYALYDMLYELTQNKKYIDAKNMTLSWLKNSAYNKAESRFNRGRGDSTIATDTFSWAIGALGPAILKENDMNPEAILEFAEDACRVKAVFYRPDNSSIEVTGFDFAKAANIGRGGIISCEWTAQMIVAFKIMAGYYDKLGDIEKSNAYYQKADYYLSQLSNMIIASPSPSGQGEGCLPYASIDNVDTGHGWRVAKGRRTGSVSATIYYIFAQSGYNPLKL
ncbi:MAG: PilZ domain-containing protein [Candidatus Omnitrophica bacterium]|nr:PilZ domain-containing protein [Candidatus Omnitrophota bacterium]